MSAGASKLRDVRKLADARANLELDIPVSQLPGLPIKLIAGGGPVQAHVQFGREQGHMVAKVGVRGELDLVCQRCLGPMSWHVDINSPVALIESESEAEAAPTEWETFLAADGRVSIEALVAEELLLELPIVPLHASGSICDAGSKQVAAPSESTPVEQEKARPFADLRALLDRGAKSKN